MRFGRIIWGRKEAVEEDARVPAELDATNHAHDSGVLEYVDIA